MKRYYCPIEERTIRVGELRNFRCYYPDWKEMEEEQGNIDCTFGDYIKQALDNHTLREL